MKITRLHHWLLSLCLLLVCAGDVWAAGTDLAAPVIRCRAQRILEHDPGAFTQGLFFWQGRLFETTGLYGHSSIRELSVQTGEPLRLNAFGDRYFAEGACAVGQEFLVLTWRAGKAFRVDPATFKATPAFSYPGQGWGLTFDGEHLIMSDGSDTLTFRDPETFTPLRRLQVHDNGQPVHRLNELEWIQGEIFANVFGDSRIAVIDEASGVVRRWLDVSLLMPLNRKPKAVLNGLAWNPERRQLYVTGKLWDRILVLPAEQVLPR